MTGKTNPPRHEAPAVPLIQGRAKHGNEHARPIIPGTGGTDQKVFHTLKKKDPLSSP